MVGLAEFVIGQRPDHIAILDLRSVAVAGDPLQLCLQFSKSDDLLAHLRKLSRRDPVGIGARPLRMLAKVDQFPDRFNREPKFSGMADEGETLLLTPTVAPLVCPLSARSGSAAPSVHRSG